MGKKDRFKKLRQNRCVQVFIFVILTALNVADLANDWLLYHDVDDAEEGLVFGRIEDSIRLSLLVFCIIGAVLFTFEIVNLGKDVFTDKPWLDMDVASALVIWIEDIPQITINLVILACREEAVSVFQLGKASVVILGAFIRMIVGIVWVCRRKSDGQKRKLQQCSFFRCIMFLGLTLMILGSGLIFIFTQTSFKHTGHLMFKEPHTLFEGQFIDEHYFQRVGVYGNIGFLDKELKDQKESPHWVKFFEIHDIRHEHKTVTIIIQFDTENRKHFMISKVFSKLNETKECYSTDLNQNWTMSTEPQCQSLFSSKNKTSKIVFHFQYVPPRNHLILGDIVYNVGGIVDNTACASGHTISPSNTSLSSKDSQIKVGNFTIGLHYYQVKKEFDGQGHLINKSSLVSFYSPDHHLVDIASVWKTGFFGCDYSGSLAPHRKLDIEIDCDKYK